MYDLVRLIASVPRLRRRTLVRPLQNGLVQFYALAMVLGLAVFVGVSGVVREVAGSEIADD